MITNFNKYKTKAILDTSGSMRTTQSMDYNESKNWEKLAKTKPNYEVGDTVYYIDDNTVIISLRYNNKYKVSEILKKNEHYFTKIEGYDEKNWYSSKFISEIEKNADKYNI